MAVTGNIVMVLRLQNCKIVRITTRIRLPLTDCKGTNIHHSEATLPWFNVLAKIWRIGKLKYLAR